MAADTSTLLMLAGAGIGGWWLYNNYFGLPSDAGYVGQLPTGQSITEPTGATLTGPGYVYYSPSAKQFYLRSSAPTQAQITAGQSLPAATGGTTTTGGTTAAPVNSTPAPTGGTVSIPAGEIPLPASNLNAVGEPLYYTAQGTQFQTPANLADLWGAVVNWAMKDPNYTDVPGEGWSSSPYHWETTLNAVWPNRPRGYSAGWPLPLDQIFSGLDLSQPITANAFWGPVQQYMQGGGLSGMMGLGYFGMGQDPTDPATADQSALGGAPVPCSSVTVPAGYVGPIDCSGGSVSYPASQSQVAALQQQVAGQTNYMPYVLGAAAIGGIALVASMRR